MNPSAVAGKFARNAVFVIAALFFGIPVVWLLLAPTKTSTELRTAPPLSFGTLQNVVDAWNHVVGYSGGIIYQWIGNSLFYTLTSVAVALLLAVPAGYALAKFDFIGRKTVLTLTLITMIVPQAALILPLYLEMSSVKLTNTPWSVILPLSFYPFGVYLVYLFATTSIPDSILEAARIDGASEFGILMRMFVPLARPAILMVGFFAFVTSWNAFFLPFIMNTSPSLSNLQTGLENLIVATGGIAGINRTNIPIHDPEVALAAIASVLPILLIFVFAQRFLVAGQVQAAEKG
jgi:multiple sugar transport system permease protein